MDRSLLVVRSHRSSQDKKRYLTLRTKGEQQSIFDTFTAYVNLNASAKLLNVCLSLNSTGGFLNVHFTRFWQATEYNSGLDSHQ